MLYYMGFVCRSSPKAATVARLNVPLPEPCRRRAGTPNPKIKPLIEESRKHAKLPPADQLGISIKVGRFIANF